MQPLLSICIPTYNRASYLYEAIESLYLQVVKYGKDVEIIVSDNASTDNTYDVIRGFKDRSEISLHYSRNESNIGLAGNFNKSVELATGKYIFLMGDDDIFTPNFLDIILPFLKNEQEYGLIHWGRLVGDANCNNNTLHNPYFTSMVSTKKPSEFIKETLSAPNFISSVLMHNKVWNLGANHEDSELPGYGQFGRMLWGAIDFDMPCVHLYMPMVIQRNPMRVWQKNWPVFLLYEMNQIFYNIDSKIEGVYYLWQNRLHDKSFYSIKDCFQMMLLSPDYYKPYFSKIAKYLDEKEKRLLKLTLYHPIFAKIFFKLNSLVSRLKRFLKL